MQFMVRIRPRPRKFFSSYSVRRKRRRPHDPSKVDLKNEPTPLGISNVSKSIKKEKKEKLEKKEKKEKNGIGAKISSIIFRLREKIQVSVVKAESTISPARADPGIVSPRKRILREMEKVSLDDLGVSSKRHRARTLPAPSKPVSSHSISSILAREDEPSFLRSLLGCSGSEASFVSFDSSPTRSTYAGNPSPSPDSVRPGACSSTHSSTPTPNVATPSPPPPPPPSKAVVASVIQPQAQHPHFPYPISMHPPFIPAHPQAPFYSGLPHYRGSPSSASYWPAVQYAMSSLPRNSLYHPFLPSFSPLSPPSSWTPLSQPAVGNFKKEEGPSGKTFFSF